MKRSSSARLTGKGFIRAFVIALLASLVARTSAFGSATEKSTASLLVLTSLGTPLICAALWWGAPRAHAWASLSISSRYGGNRRKQALRMELQRLISAQMLVMICAWTLMLSIYDGSAQILQDAGVSAPFLLLLVYSQSGLCSACYSWAGRFGLALVTLLSLSIGLSVQPNGTVLPTDLSKLLLGHTQLIEQTVTTPHAALALLFVGSLAYLASLLKVAP